MCRENVEKNLLFCKEQRQCTGQAITTRSVKQFRFTEYERSDSSSLRHVNLDYLDNWRKSVLLFLLEKWADWVSEMVRVSAKVTQLAWGCESIGGQIRLACQHVGLSLWPPSQPSNRFLHYNSILFSETALRRYPRLGKISTEFSSSDPIRQQPFLETPSFSKGLSFEERVPWMNKSAFSLLESTILLIYKYSSVGVVFHVSLNLWLAPDQSRMNYETQVSEMTKMKECSIGFQGFFYGLLTNMSVQEQC